MGKRIPTPKIGTSSANEVKMKMVEEAQLKDLKVKNYLFQEIDRQILETILNKWGIGGNLEFNEVEVSRIH